jgi:hypothetical protein
MARVQTYECLDARATWQSTPCLCDCHYRAGGVCGDVDAASQPKRVRIPSPKRMRAYREDRPHKRSEGLRGNRGTVERKGR